MPRRTLVAHLAALAWAVVLALLLLLPAAVYPDADSGWLGWLLDGGALVDKVAHAVLFGIMAWLAVRSFAAMDLPRTGALAALVASAYGALLDLAQTLVPGRETEGLDMIANTVGAICGAIMASSIRTPMSGVRTYRSSGRGSEPEDSAP